MGLFDKLFGNRKRESIAPPKSGHQQNSSEPAVSSKKSKENKFITNSSEYGLGEIELGITGKIRVDGLMAIASLDDLAKKRGVEYKYEVMYTTLLEEGALTVPVVVKLGEEKYSLYFIYNEEDLLKYKDLLNHVKRTDYPKLIYFSSIPIYEGYQPKKIIEPFQLADLRFEKDAKISGTYAMWWKTEEDSIFHNSVAYEHLSKIYEIFKGYETYLTGYVLRQTRIEKDVQLKRTKLPEGSVEYVIHAPENKKIVMSISQEKGIRFLFPINTTKKSYLERFLKGIMVDFLATRLSLQQHDAPQDEEIDPNSYDWFTFMSRVIKANEEKGEEISLVGGLNLNIEMN